MDQYLLFQIQSQKFALSIKVIDRAVRACAIRPLPNSSIHVLGMLDLQGTVIPVVTLRTLLGIDAKSIDLSDMMIICKSLDKQLALLVDGIHNIESCPDKPSAVSSNIPMPFF